MGGSHPVPSPGINDYPCDPLPLLPLGHVSKAHRVRCPVQDRHGKNLGAKLMVQTLDCSRSYVFERLLMENHKTGVSLLLSQEVKPQGTDPTTSAITLTSTGTSVVVKVVPRSNKARQLFDSPLREIAAMQQLSLHDPSHPHIVPLLDCMQDEHFYYLVLPYLPGGDLYQHLEMRGGKGFPEYLAQPYLRDMVEGLLFMKRTCGLAHHDVSLENAMVDYDGNVRIIDLGMCLQVPQLMQAPITNNHDDKSSCLYHPHHQQRYQTALLPVCLTPQPCCGKASYVSPQVIREEAHDPFAADMWSLGVCLYMMLTGGPLYNSPNDQAFKMMEQGQVREVVECYEIHHRMVLSPCAKDLVCRMLHADPTQRPTLEEVLIHPFLSKGSTATPPTTTTTTTTTMMPSGVPAWAVPFPVAARTQ